MKRCLALLCVLCIVMAIPASSLGAGAQADATPAAVIIHNNPCPYLRSPSVFEEVLKGYLYKTDQFTDEPLNEGEVTVVVKGIISEQTVIGTLKITSSKVKGEIEFQGEIKDDGSTYWIGRDIKSKASHVVDLIGAFEPPSVSMAFRQGNTGELLFMVAGPKVKPFSEIQKKYHSQRITASGFTDFEATSTDPRIRGTLTTYNLRLQTIGDPSLTRENNGPYEHRLWTRNIPNQEIGAYNRIVEGEIKLSIPPSSGLALTTFYYPPSSSSSSTISLSIAYKSFAVSLSLPFDSVTYQDGRWVFKGLWSPEEKMNHPDTDNSDKGFFARHHLFMSNTATPGTSHAMDYYGRVVNRHKLYGGGAFYFTYSATLRYFIEAR